MTPTPITVPLTSPGVPVTFVLNGTGELEVKSVVATFDGTGAGVTFDAVCSVYTQDDKLISRTKPASSIAAGASAVVTFAPFLRKPAAAAAAGGIPAGFKVTSTADQFIGNGVTAELLFGTTFVSFGSPFTTVDHKTFTLTPGTWSLRVQVALEYNNPGADGAAHLQLVNKTTTGILTESLETIAAAGPASPQFTMETEDVTEVPATVTNVVCKLINVLGDTVRVIGGGDLSYMSGELLKAA